MSGRVTGLLLGRLDRTSIIFMKNIKNLEKLFFSQYFFEIGNLKFLRFSKKFQNVVENSGFSKVV